MKKILVFAYLRNNVGDDLFVVELLNRYSNHKFYINVLEEKYGEPFKKYKNAIIQKVNKENFEGIEIDSYDGFVYIGGSIFMEGGKVYNLDDNCYQFIKTCKKLKKPFFYISSNYGPYKSKEYFELSKKNFANCTDLCFRDKYSYNLFQEISSVRYAPDAAFIYPTEKIEKEKNTIGLCLIDLEIRDTLKQKEKQHIELISHNIDTYMQEGKKVYLFSFCEQEGDENVFQKLYQTNPKPFKENKIKIIRYKDDIEKFIEEYKKMEYMICERFHSLILSCIFRQNLFVISYSSKIDRVIEELDLCEKYIKLENINQIQHIPLTDFKLLEEHKLEKIKNQAQKQFEKLDEFLDYKSKNLI